jgi:exodeoxyribonuclease-5
MNSSDKQLTVSDLSADQREAHDRVLAWIRDINASPILTLGGLAGCGKTALLGVIGRSCGVSPIAYATYTGKAASVLKRKLIAAGINTTGRMQSAEDKEESVNVIPDNIPYCGTIHGLIYAPIEDAECATCGHVERRHNRNNNTGILDACEGCPCKLYVAKSTGRVNGWRRRDTLDRAYKLIALDEASMISDDILEDLQSFNIPLLAVGDHGQLPPVGGLGTLVQNPDIRLEKIHRQAEGSPIIRMSRMIRDTGKLNPATMRHGDTIVFDRIANLQKHIEQRYKGASTARLFELGLISGTNKRRISLNQAVRKALGRSGPPTPGEQVICLRNMRERGIYNGMRGVIEEVTSMSEMGRPWCMTAEVRFPEEGITDTVSMCMRQFNREKAFNSFEELAEFNIFPAKWDDVGGLFDFGYALTAHRCQGSSYEDAMVIAADWMGNDADTKARWLYTSATRAVSKLTILTP